MITDPADYAEAFVRAGADVVTFHVEAVTDPRPLLEHLRSQGVGAGLALNPDTPLTVLSGCLGLCDLVLIMSVPAGFGKQKFDPGALERLRQVRQWTGDRVMLEVDGGVNQSTIRACTEAGARYFVVGSAIFSQDDYAPVVRALQELTAVS
jgi:ribulose-phosphate 3-epimerase